AYGEVKMAFVHHTENPNGYSAVDVPSMLRAIYAFHRDVNGWNDIGYNFVVDRFGRVFEARAGGVDEPVVGAHAGGYNLVSTGIAVLGSFSGTPISAPARRTLQRLLAWKLALHGVATQGRVQVRVNPAGAVYSKYPARARVSLPRIAGHRDADSTDCPGNSLYGELPGVRRAVASLPGRTVIAALALVAPPEVAQPAPAGGEPPPPGAPPTVPAAGSAPELLTTLTLLDGTPVTGAQVVLEARMVARRGEAVTRTALAEGMTDGEGHCLLPASFAVGAAKPLWVRALYPGGTAGGAAVSRTVRVDPLEAAVIPPAGSSPSG
ncbi:MAG TPA: N-acetylmuramoyl-L-alanine amidase, partial [Solirubrobacteraceae bacterium]